MAIKTEQRDMVVERLASHLLEHGLARTTLRELAAAAGVSDRMLMYYFRDKAEVMAATVAEIGQRLIVALNAAIPADTALSPAMLARHAAEVTTRPALKPYMRFWIEVVAAAGRREEPFVTIAALMMTGFRDWIEPRLDLPAGPDRQAAALGVIAICDGLALIDICSGGAAADLARSALPLAAG
ncbi:TetR/AcrR family transcriptional regulator [Novosphingobium sp.]|uniref:TetR/AcrR family transcriptional regulator n=1 Tax=Novosphingobium sp. TaxID=1874826 RepID=UPI00333F24BB